jgi:orotidine-5'-phosphate decarboxylase
VRDRLLVALDVARLADAEALLDRLAGVLTGCKIGSQLFTAAGPAAVEAARARGFAVFLDLKYHDIPSTVAGAVREAARLGVFMLNVHATGGLAMMRAAAEAATAAATEPGTARPRCLAVTVLTSLDRRALETELGVHATVPAHVLALAERAREAGLDGCVASPREIGLLRRALGPHWLIVTPGIRPAESASHDQARVATPRTAIGAGADYLVVGRPITAAPDPAAAAEAILTDLARP